MKENGMRRFSGHVLIAVGIVHNIVGIVGYSRPLADIGRGGVFNAVVPHFDRDAAFWFLMSGVLIFILGQLARWSQQRTGILPAFLGWELLAVAVVLAILMPVSGWPLVVTCSGLLLAASRGDGAKPALSTENSKSRIW